MTIFFLHSSSSYALAGSKGQLCMLVLGDPLTGHGTHDSLDLLREDCIHVNKRFIFATLQSRIFHWQLLPSRHRVDYWTGNVPDQQYIALQG